jgi:tripartite-type tricarboxylate transporter receptor subunit TctC
MRPFRQSPRWQGPCATKNTPADIIAKLNKEIDATVVDPEMKARLADLGTAGGEGAPGG